MKTVVIESPYKGNVERNVKYAKEAVLDSLRRGEAPFASHLLYTQVLDDQNPKEREAGISAGLEYHKHGRADIVAFYADLGFSEGMKRALKSAIEESVEIEIRSLPGWSML